MRGRRNLRQSELSPHYIEFRKNPQYKELGKYQRSFLEAIGSSGKSMSWTQALKIFNNNYHSAVKSIGGLLVKGFWFEIKDIPVELVEQIDEYRKTLIASGFKNISLDDLIKEKLSEFDFSQGSRNWSAFFHAVMQIPDVMRIYDPVEKSRYAVELIKEISSGEDLQRLLREDRGVILEARPTQTSRRRAEKSVSFQISHEHEELLRDRISIRLFAKTNKKPTKSAVRNLDISINKQLDKEHFKDALERLKRAEVLLEEYLNRNTM